MNAEGTQADGDPSGSRELSMLLEPVRAALSQAVETERYRILAGLFAELADQGPGSNGREDASQARSLNRQIQDLQHKNANLEDELRRARDDLTRRDDQLEAEAARSRDLEASLTKQRERVEELEKEREMLDAQLVARNNDLHKFEGEREELLIKVQRLELKTSDTSQVESLEGNKRDLLVQIEELKAATDQLRSEKDAEIEAYKEKLAGSEVKEAGSADALLMQLWDRLARAKPDSLAQGGVQPTVQAAEHLVDSFIELAIFTHKMDQDMRVFLNNYTKHQQAISRQWQVYSDKTNFLQTVEETVAPQVGQQVGVLRMKLKAFGKFTVAAMTGSDAAFLSIARELQEQLLGKHGAGADPNYKVKDYVRDQGPHLFMEHMMRFRSEKIAEVFPRV